MLCHEKLKHFTSKSLFKQFHGNRRKRDEHPIGAKQAVGRKHMDMGVEGYKIAEVDFDDETGEAGVLRIVAAHDCGAPINPMLVEGQVAGSRPFR